MFCVECEYFFLVNFLNDYFISENNNRHCTKTDIVQKASIVFNEWASQEISLYRGTSAIELEWTVGPIPIEDNVGKEIIIRYNTNIDSGSKYYTDANGREVLERTRDHRPTWHYIVDEPISGNYYPINSRIWIRDNDRQLTILTGKIDFSNEFFSLLEIILCLMFYRSIRRWWKYVRWFNRNYASSSNTA